MTCTIGRKGEESQGKQSLEGKEKRKLLLRKAAVVEEDDDGLVKAKATLWKREERKASLRSWGFLNFTTVVASLKLQLNFAKF